MPEVFKKTKIILTNLIFIFVILISAKSYAIRISPYFGVGSDAFIFTLSNLNGTQSDLQYEPNIPGLSRFGLSALGYGLSYSTRSDQKDLDPEKGSSTFVDYQLGYHEKNWGIDTYFQQYQGFYLKNSSDFSLSSYQLNPNLKFQHYGFMARYAFDNSGFSINQLLTQTEQITQTSGSYFATYGYRHYNLNDDQTLIPSTLQSSNVGMTDLRKLSSQSLNLGLGAGKYWVSSSHLFIGAVLDLNATLARYQYTFDDNEKRESYYGTTSYGLRLGTGYSGKNWRFGLNAISDVTTLQGFDRSYIKPSATSFLIYIRYDNQ